MIRGIIQVPKSYVGFLEDGSAVQAKFKTWLDRLATFAGELKDDQRKPIPVIFRPFHEHTDLVMVGKKLHYGGGVYRSLEVYSQLSP